MLRPWRQLDIIFASTLLILSLGSAVYAYASIIKVEAPDFVLISGLTLGEQKSVIKQGKKCVGNILSELFHDSTFELKANGKIRAEYASKVSQIDIRLHAIFNPLGQLGDSGLFVNGPQGRLEIFAREINPIKVRIKAEMRGKVFERKFEIRGPLMLNKAGPTYQLEYAHLPSSNNSLLQAISATMPSDIHLRLSTTSPLDCSDGDGIDVTPVLTSLRTLLAPFAGLFPDIEELSL